MMDRRMRGIESVERVNTASLVLLLACSIGLARVGAAQSAHPAGGDPTPTVAAPGASDSTANQVSTTDSAALKVSRLADAVPAARATVDLVADATREYERTGVARTIEEGAFLTFPYGHSQPTVTCAPLRACVIELQAGESVLSRIAGDTQRWEIELAPAGADGHTPLVVVKPHDCGLTTNLVLTTTAGRIYDLTLDSPPCVRGGLNPHGVYARHVRFYYPDATVQAWSAPPSAPAALADHPVPAARAEAFNFAYRVRRLHRFPWIPLAVFDDGVHCYIKLPPQAAHRDAPVLFAVHDDGSKELLNYSVNNETYVTDRVFRSAVLVIGDVDTEQVLRLDNMHFDAVGDAADGGGTGGGSTNPELQQ
jgi:type IV secretion system protein TrbG